MTVTHPAAHILSANFASWDRITADGNYRYLCQACAWTYKTRPGLLRPLLVTLTPPAVTEPTFARLRDILAGPIPAHMSLIVPASGKQTLAPLAQWGRLTYDGGTITWTPRHAKLLDAATQLRQMGAWERSLMDPSPPLKMLDELPADEHATVRALWRVFDEARHNETLGPLMLRLTRKDQTP